MIDFDELSQRLSTGSPVTAEDVILFEKASGIALPDDYLEFLRRSDGVEGFLSENAYMILWRLNEVLDLNDAYRTKEYAPGMLIFGSSGGGEAYGFDTRSETSRILAVPFVPMTLEEAYAVAPTFGLFLEKLSAGGSTMHSTDDGYRKAPSRYPGKEICEIKPIKLGGSPTDPANKMLLARSDHVKYVTYWNRIIRGLLEGRAP